MADERGNRETVFPGSNQWTGIFGSASARVSNKNALDPSTAAHNPRNKLQINLPVNPAGSYAEQLVPVKEGSPWKYYRRAYDLELGGNVAVVCRTPATGELYAMHSLSGPCREKKLYMLRQLKHENLLKSEEIFSFESSFHVISEYTAISLEGIIVVRPTETQLAAIVHQVLQAIRYLESQQLAHGSISCSSVLLTNKGVVKLANSENCSTIGPENRLADARALGLIMNELMGERLGDSVTADLSETTTSRLKPTDWSAEVIDFMTLTRTAPVSELVQHSFVSGPAQTNELIPLVDIAMVSACRYYDLQNSYMHLRSSL